MPKFRFNPCRVLIAAALACAVVLATLAGGARAETPRKILLTPFQILAAEDLTYLQRGIREMLATRLAWEGRVVVLRSDQSAPPSQDEALDLAAKMGADYVLLGSLTVLGGKVSTDARVLEADTRKQVLVFGRAGAQQSDVIDHVDQLAAEINSRLFSRVAGAKPAAPEASKPAVQSPADQSTIYQHPEKLLTGAGAPGEPGERLSPEDARLATLQVRSRKMDGQITGLTAGDVDGDTRQEIITVTSAGGLLVQRIDQGRWIKVAQIEGIGNYIGVDAADLNGNGRAEIFVTNFDNPSSRLDSFVLEWDGHGLQRVAQHLNWYFRAVDLPDRGRVLAGQRQGAADRFGAGIFEIVRRGDDYEAGERLPLPRSLNVFGFGYGRIRPNEDEEIAAYNANGYIQILKRNGEEEWVTSERYGVGANFILFPNKVDGIEKESVYLKPRVLLYDLDGDGLQEILAVANEQSTDIMPNTRFFKKGHLEWLKWDALGMTTVLRIQSLAKYVADVNLADLNGDGRPEMLVAIVQKEAGLLGKGSSYLAVFDLPQPPHKEN